nr:hypothetical protein BaRGS_021211 [Batillaria attramentaria]
MFEIPDQEEFEKKGKIETMREFKPHDTVDWALEEELKKRRKKYFAEVEQRAEQFDPNEYRDFHEKDDHLAFVTAGSDRTWAGVLQFVYSVQYHYPDSSIGVFDLGLSREHREQLETFCKVVVLPVYMKFWPKHMTNLKLTLWRPILWQIGLVHFGHIVYVEPDRFLMTKTMKQYIEHSRRWGMTVVGKKLQYSPYVVTNPEMYFFLQVDTRKLQRVEMFDISMVVLHNSQPVRHFLMRHLVACTLEEYCIAPPGSQLACDQRLYPGSKKYANCHRYDLSAINILMYKWADFNADQFLVRDIVTANYDGKDVSHKVKVCTSNERVEM